MPFKSQLPEYIADNEFDMTYYSLDLCVVYSVSIPLVFVTTAGFNGDRYFHFSGSIDWPGNVPSYSSIEKSRVSSYSEIRTIFLGKRRIGIAIEPALLLIPIVSP